MLNFMVAQQHKPTVKAGVWPCKCVVPSPLQGAQGVACIAVPIYHKIEVLAAAVEGRVPV